MIFKMRFIGDIHHQFGDYIKLVGDAPASIQVGDFGVGFGSDPMVDDSPVLGPTHRFIRGNHDNPDMCRAHPNYIGDICLDGSTFFMSGAYSIDRDIRTAGRDWWDGEQLSYPSLMNAINIYEEARPRVVVTHDCPISVARFLFKGRTVYPNSTSNALETMFEIHKPKLWVFGHWHINVHQVVLGTHFHCIGVNDFRDIEMPS